MALTETTKNKLLDLCRSSMRENSFGDGQEDEMIMHGHSFVGLLNLSDQGLVDEYESYSYDEDEDELLIIAKQEMEVDKLLKGG